MKPHGFYQKVSIYIGMGMARISVETTVIIYFTPIVCFVVVKSLSRIWFFAIPWTAACQDSLSFTISWSLLKFKSTVSVMLSNHLCPLPPPSLFYFVFSNIRVFSNESALHNRWPKYWCFNFSISPSYEYSALIFFRIDWFDFLAVQGTLSRIFSSTTIQKHQPFSTQPFLRSNSHIHTWLLEKP